MILTDTLLATALARTARTIALFDATGKAADLQPDQAAILLATKRYEAVGTKRRVRYIRVFDPSALTPPRPELPFLPCYLNSAAPVLRFWADQVSPGIGSTLNSFGNDIVDIPWLSNP